MSEEIKFTPINGGVTCPFMSASEAFVFASALHAQGVNAEVRDQKVGLLTLPAVFVADPETVLRAGYKIGPALGSGPMAQATVQRSVPPAGPTF